MGRSSGRRDCRCSSPSSDTARSDCLVSCMVRCNTGAVQKEETLLLLADIFSRCYGNEPIKDIPHISFVGGPRIDPKYVNNPEMSDIQFRVEGRPFYSHRIILVNASPKFQALVAGAGSQAVVIKDIRYHIFQLVMEYLYKGGCEDFLQLEQNDVLEWCVQLMAAADFFQLDGLTRLCEVQCSRMLDADNAVSMYIHAQVYGATHLLEYCRGFLLQHLVALLSYDDSLRRLLFGKRLLNHDVLSGLLLTLQARHRERGRPSRNSNGV
ncbi:ABTB2 [Cordylochernes scorpioides]|uniref:ABTB2 n=1 Tax=Cordylochernes scorpioides TaxID=51811 RepID=A0ABY6L5K6_9ARAC|nr:ABTB2 [Cordylochernes scorpioides]